MKKMMILVSIVSIAFLIGFMAFVHADDNADDIYYENLIKKLMKELKASSGSKAEYSIPPEEIWQNLVKDNLKMEGTELLLRRTSISYTQDDEIICTVDVDFAASEQDAILRIFGRMASSTMSEEAIMDNYKVWKKGPGSLCIVGSDFDENAQKYCHPAHRKITFIRDGLVVRIDSYDNVDCEIDEIAKLIDEQIILTSEKIKKGDVIVQSEEEIKAMESARADDIKKYQENSANKLRSQFNIPSGDETDYSIPPKEIWHNVEKDNIKMEGTERASADYNKTHLVYQRDGESFYSVKVEFANSEKEAILNVFRELAQTNDSMIKRKKIWKEGPGSLCIIDSRFNEETQKIDLLYSQFVFIRNGIIVRITNFDADCEIGKIARLIDEQILLTTAKMKQELLDAQQSSESSYQWEMDKKESADDTATDKPVISPDNRFTATDKPVTDSTNNHTLVIILLALVALLAVGGGAFYYMRNRK